MDNTFNLDETTGIDEPLIAGTYRLIGKMGSGGGGIVYLGEHIRLGKRVVLKADKRPITTKPEVLRREVDALKNLSHTYIPQVYDFIVENDIVYTVMDYIDGESFDRPLARGERYTQAEVVEWAQQLLEAIEYLHAQPPYGILHADIKPANIMRTPQGDVRLIDFNIALALGEEGAVAVGRSFGYASPEHYGQGLSGSNSIQADEPSYINTILDPTMRSPSSSGSSGSSTSKKVLLDKRSDIYSLGATLYHLLSGERPQGGVAEVKPLSAKSINPEVAIIIAKAMNPNPDQRWQSATEMLQAFRQLRENDPRVKRHKRRIITSVAISVFLLLLGGYTAFYGQRLMVEQEAILAMQILEEEAAIAIQQAEDEAALASQQAEEAASVAQQAEEEAYFAQREAELQAALVFAGLSGTALQNGDIASAINYALAALPTEDNAFTPPLTAEAQFALAGALGIYDISDGFKSHGIIELPSAPFYVTLSPNGRVAAFVHASGVSLHDTYTAELIALLPGGTSALSQAVFLNDNTLIYAGQVVRAFDISSRQELWAGGNATAIAVSANGTRVATIYRDSSYARIYNAATGELLYIMDFNGKHQHVVVNDVFANPNNNLLALNEDGTWLGVSFACGSLWIYDLTEAEYHIDIFDNGSGFLRYSGGFYGSHFAFSATQQGESVFAVICTVEIEQTGGFSSASPFNVLVDNYGVAVQTQNILVRIHPVTGVQTALVTTAENITGFATSSTHTVISIRDGFLFFDDNAQHLSSHENNHDTAFVQVAGEMALLGSRDTPIVRIMRLENHADANVFSFDPSLDLVEARISADRTTIMLFTFNRFRLFNIAYGEMIAEVVIPNAAQVFDQQFHRSGMDSYLEVIFNDGWRKFYCAMSGDLLREYMGDLPDLTFFEEFFTDTLHITSELHGVPRAYCIVTGDFVRELERDAYLTYVTQAGDYIVTQYITARGYVFGVLLNANGEALAYLPHLVDVKGTSLFFKYPTGNVRESRIFHINELIEFARSH